jgi:hypothetical protein
MTGFKVWENYKIFRTSTKEYTRTNQLEETSRTLIDIATGACIRTKLWNVYGISLRVENTITIHLHLMNIVPTYMSEVHKWKHNRNNYHKKPHHVQFNKISDDKVLVIRVNIDAFGMF